MQKYRSVIKSHTRILVGNSMVEVFSVMEEITKRLSRPYISQSLTSFLLTKDNCYIDLKFAARGRREQVRVEGWVGRSMLCLDPETLCHFIARLRKLKSLHKTASNIRLHLTPMSREYSEDSYPIFPRIQYGIIGDLSVEKIANFVEGTFKVLLKIGNLVDEFRVKDKSFESLKELWSKVNSSEDSNKKGRLLEDFFSLLIAKDEDFNLLKRNLRTESEELDLLVETTGMTKFYSQLKSPMILFECKNWSSRIGTGEVQKFAQKIQNRSRLLCNIGLLVTTSELTKKANTELVGYRGKDFLIAVMEKKDIETMLEKQLGLSEVVKEAIRNAGFR